MKNLRIGQIAFIAVLAALHLPFIFESFWYDEAAVAANTIHQGIGIKDGLNWLQTIPPGYFLMIKTFLKFENGIFICRLISLILLVTSVFIIDKEYFYKLKHQSLSYLGISALLINSFSLRYATDIKPYTFELFLSVGILVTSSKQRTRWLILFCSLGPALASTTFILGIPAVIYFGIKFRRRIYFIPLVANILMTWFTSHLIPESTKNLMKLEWFGNSSVGPSTALRSTLGGLFWLPTSGTGWLPDDFSMNYPMRYQLSGLIFIISIVLVTVTLNRTPEYAVLVLGFGVVLLLNAIKILPPAGRLLQGLATILTILVILAIDKLMIRWRYFLPLFLCVALSCSGNYVLKSRNFNAYDGAFSFSKSARLYSFLDVAPEVQYSASRFNLNISPNIFSFSQSGVLQGCRQQILYKGDRVYIRYKKGQQPNKINGFKFSQSAQGMSYYESVKQNLIGEADSSLNFIECRFKFRNPERKLLY